MVAQDDKTTLMFTEVESRTQGSRPRPRTQKNFEAKDTDASVLQKKKGLQNFFSGDLYLRKPKKRSLQIFRKVSGVFQRNFHGSKIVLSSSRGQGNFRGLEFEAKAKDFKMCPRGLHLWMFSLAIFEDLRV